jgi:hypothetical protein
VAKADLVRIDPAKDISCNDRFGKDISSGDRFSNDIFG